MCLDLIYQQSWYDFFIINYTDMNEQIDVMKYPINLRANKNVIKWR